jgi:SAM-dependent methyltransferase
MSPKMPVTIGQSPDAWGAVPLNYRRGARPTWHQRRRHRAVLSLLRGATGRVLDYGCGYGDLTHAMSLTHDVVGCDVDATRVAFAQHEYAPIEFVECGRSGTPFDDRSFDVVVSAVVIHFVPDADAYLAEVRRLLRPGGRLLIACKNRPVVRNAVRRAVGRGDARPRVWLLPLAEMRAILMRHGFETIDSTYFYDPPLAGWKNSADWAFGFVEQFLSVLRVRPAADYHVYLTRYGRL